MKKSALAAIKKLEDYHEKGLPEKAIGDYCWAFEQHMESDLDAAIAEWKRTNAPVGRFPSIADIERCAFVVRDRRMAVEKNKHTQSEMTFRKRAERSGGEMAKEAFALMDEMFKIGAEGVPNPERREFVLRRMMELDAKYPRANWGMEADKLRMAWAAQNEAAEAHASLHERLGGPERRKIGVENV